MFFVEMGRNSATDTVNSTKLPKGFYNLLPPVFFRSNHAALCLIFMSAVSPLAENLLSVASSDNL